MKAANPAKNFSSIQIRSTYAHIKIDMEKSSLTGIKIIQVNIKSNYISISISRYIGFPDKNIFFLFTSAIPNILGIAEIYDIKFTRFLLENNIIDLCKYSWFKLEMIFMDFSIKDGSVIA